MPRGSKDKYTDKQKRKAEHIEDSYKAKGVSEDEAEARAWATVNKQSGGGERAGGSGRKKSAAAKADDREESARRAVATKRGVPRSRSTPGRDEKTRAQLMEEARAKGIRGRSTMRKAELIEALKKAG
jgi:plasmid stabilization system protein ParE